MNLGWKTGLLGTAAALAIAVTSVPAYAQDDLSALRQQLETMKERLAKLEADKAGLRVGEYRFDQGRAEHGRSRADGTHHQGHRGADRRSRLDRLRQAGRVLQRRAG